MIIKGGAIKENGKDVNGFIELEIIIGNSSFINQLETINNGFFSINISLPNDMEAGAYLTKLNASILAAKQAYKMADISPKEINLADIRLNC